MKNQLLEILESLEQFRVKAEKGETSGSIDWAIRMCQAKVAQGHFENRVDWTKALKAKWSNGKKLVVERIYQLTDKEMKESELTHRNRVKLRNVNDYSDVHDFAIREDE